MFGVNLTQREYAWLCEMKKQLGYDTASNAVRAMMAFCQTHQKEFLDERKDKP